jgi:hypothetical protein
MADAHAHVQRLVSVAKVVTVLEVYTTKEQNSVMRFFWAKGLNGKDIYKDNSQKTSMMQVSTHW